MSDKEKDPPLAGKPKPSSLTDFELKALNLQKEGKIDELNKEIAHFTKDIPEAPPEETAVSEMDMKAYEGILRQTSQPTNIANIPSKQRKEIEEGFALLKQITDDKELVKELWAAHNKAVKVSKDQTNALKPPVLPEGLKPIIREEAPKVENEKPTQASPAAPVSGDVSTNPEVKASAPKVEKEEGGGLKFINDIKSPAAEAAKTSTPPVEPDPPKYIPYTATQSYADHSPINLLTNCQHCGWDLKKEDLTEASSSDKEDFVQSILGGIRFKKTYSMFKDKYKITFRALTSKESDIAYRQIVIDGQRDYKTKVLGGTDFYWRNLQAYRLAMSLESIESVTYGKLEIPTLEDAEIDGTTNKQIQDKLIPFLNFVLDSFIPLESTRSIVGHAYFEFQSLCDKLQVMAESPNFWKAIE
jgi:hypothetical protein